MNIAKQWVMGASLLAGAIFGSTTKANAQQNGRVEEIDYGNGRKGHVTWSDPTEYEEKGRKTTRSKPKSEKAILRNLIPGYSFTSYDVAEVNMNDDDGIITTVMYNQNINDALKKDDGRTYPQTILINHFKDNGNGYLDEADKIVEQSWGFCTFDLPNNTITFATMSWNGDNPMTISTDIEIFDRKDVTLITDDNRKIIDATASKPAIESYGGELYMPNAGALISPSSLTSNGGSTFVGPKQKIVQATYEAVKRQGFPNGTGYTGVYQPK